LSFLHQAVLAVRSREFVLVAEEQFEFLPNAVDVAAADAPVGGIIREPRRPVRDAG
jgi:hypothetical protein